MIEIIFLIILAAVFMALAVVNDVKERIVPNWLNFSLIIFALGFRFFYSLFNENFPFFYHGLAGFGIFFILGNAFYYGRIFAGGDAKLMIALGAVLPFSTIPTMNFKIFAVFFFLFLISGAVYGFIWSIFLPMKNFKEFRKELSAQFEKNKKKFYPALIFGILLLAAGILTNPIILYFGLIVLIMPYLYFYAKAVDENCLVRNVKTKNLTGGDWLYKDVKIGNRTIKARWDGLSESEIKILRKKFKSVKIRQGIPFTPVFLMSFLILVWLYFSNSFIFEMI
ncbi:prepilin peptidase [Candidatus Pacearchaeota archaeon]|nr:prepilin peptidase [Candidatus Pacearchaeota archaeon]